MKKLLQNRLDKVLNPPSSVPLSEIIDELDDNSQVRIDHLESDGMKTIFLSTIIVIWTRLEVLLGLKLMGHTDTLSAASI